MKIFIILLIGVVMWSDMFTKDDEDSTNVPPATSGDGGFIFKTPQELSDFLQGLVNTGLKSVATGQGGGYHSSMPVTVNPSQSDIDAVDANNAMKKKLFYDPVMQNYQQKLDFINSQNAATQNTNNAITTQSQTGRNLAPLGLGTDPSSGRPLIQGAMQAPPDFKPPTVTFENVPQAKTTMVPIGATFNKANPPGGGANPLKRTAMGTVIGTDAGGAPKPLPYNPQNKGLSGNYTGAVRNKQDAQDIMGQAQEADSDNTTEDHFVVPMSLIAPRNANDPTPTPGTAAGQLTKDSALQYYSVYKFIKDNAQLGGYGVNQMFYITDGTNQYTPGQVKQRQTQNSDGTVEKGSLDNLFLAINPVWLAAHKTVNGQVVPYENSSAKKAVWDYSVKVATELTQLNAAYLWAVRNKGKFDNNNYKGDHPKDDYLNKLTIPNLAAWLNGHLTEYILP